MNLPLTKIDLAAFDVIVFDVLGTLVDEPAGLKSAIGSAVPTAQPPTVDALTARWQQYVADQQSEIAAGGRSFVESAVLDVEAAELVLQEAERLGATTDPVAARQLATASERLPPWPDSVAELERIAQRVPILALSNAAPATLLRLAANTGLRWHEAVSADAATGYKPAPALYRRAIEVTRCSAARILMVAAHAWDLRAAQGSGMSTCYVARSVGDPPNTSDRFGAVVEGLGALR